MTLSIFLIGITVAMFAVASVFFLKFWRASRNRFFGLFAIAFALFALERLISLGAFFVMDPAVYQELEARGWTYLVRLAGFIIIFFAIIDRNRSKSAKRKAAQRS